MHYARILAAATIIVSLFSVTSANACYRHTFDKCDGGIQVAEATPPASQPPEASKLLPSARSGWVTTVTVSR